MSETLQPCPMCHEPASLDTIAPRVICLTPDCPMPPIERATPELALRDWNRRTPDAADRESLRKVREEMAEARNYSLPGRQVLVDHNKLFAWIAALDQIINPKEGGDTV